MRHASPFAWAAFLLELLVLSLSPFMAAYLRLGGMEGLLTYYPPLLAYSCLSAWLRVLFLNYFDLFRSLHSSKAKHEIMHALAAVLLGTAIAAIPLGIWQRFDLWGPPLPQSLVLMDGLMASTGVVVIRLLTFWARAIHTAPGQLTPIEPVDLQAKMLSPTLKAPAVPLGLIGSSFFIAIIVGGAWLRLHSLDKQTHPLSATPQALTVQPKQRSGNSKWLVVDAAGHGDYQTIEQALAAVPQEGAIVLIKRGDYTGGFSVPANTTLRGAGDHHTRIFAPISWTKNAITVNTNKVTIENLEIDGQREHQPHFLSIQNICGLHVKGQDVTIRDCYIHDTRNIGISASSTASDLHIKHCTIENTATAGAPGGTPGYHFAGILCMGSQRPIIQENLIRGWSQAVGLWYGVTNGLVKGNRMLSNYGFQDDAHLCRRSACEDYGAAVRPHGWNHWIDNVVDGSTSHCLEIAQGVEGSQFVNNVLRHPGQISGQGVHWGVVGAVGQKTHHILIQGNRCYSDGSRPETCPIYGNASDISVINNTFIGFNHPSSCGPIKIGPGDSIARVLIQKNHFFNCRFGIQSDNRGSDISITDNVFHNPVGASPVLAITGGLYPKFSHNIIQHNTNGSRTSLAIPQKIQIHDLSGGY